MVRAQGDPAKAEWWLPCPPGSCPPRPEAGLGRAGLGQANGRYAPLTVCSFWGVRGAGWHSEGMTAVPLAAQGSMVSRALLGPGEGGDV